MNLDYKYFKYKNKYLNNNITGGSLISSVTISISLMSGEIILDNLPYSDVNKLIEDFDNIYTNKMYNLVYLGKVVYMKYCNEFNQVNITKLINENKESYIELTCLLSNTSFSNFKDIMESHKGDLYFFKLKNNEIKELDYMFLRMLVMNGYQPTEQVMDKFIYDKDLIIFIINYVADYDYFILEIINKKKTINEKDYEDKTINEKEYKEKTINEKDYEEIALAAISKKTREFSYLKEDLKKDESFIIKCLKIKPILYESIHPDLKSSIDIKLFMSTSPIYSINI